MMMIYAAGGGGLIFLLIICICIMKCRKKNREENQIKNEAIRLDNHSKEVDIGQMGTIEEQEGTHENMDDMKLEDIEDGD